tara:strand:+ start:98 stop:1294 length:1197 start_codon:yes stop_codon:yes gene_type:complete
MFFSFFFILFYLLIFFKNKRKLKILDLNLSIDLKKRVKIIQETISIFRQIRINNIKKYFFEIFKSKDKAVREHSFHMGFISSFPRLVIEGVAIIFIAFVSYYLVKLKSFDEEEILALIATMVFAASRLLPSIQKVYQSYVSLAGVRKVAFDVSSMLQKNIYSEQQKIKENKIRFNHKINIENLDFNYTEEESNKIFQNLNLEINKNSIIGIYGKTGSGKSTLIDLLVGLIQPNKGEIKIDGVSIFNNLQDWNQKISYVDQNITLVDSSIRENIAIGVEIENINEKKIIEASKLAQLEEFVETLENKYNTIIGERGIRLSGGQIQRIGIARALYANSELIILDESTNALDFFTEDKIIKSIRSLKTNKTIIIISHKMNTLKDCEKVYEIKNKNIFESKI